MRKLSELEGGRGGRGEGSKGGGGRLRGRRRLARSTVACMAQAGGALWVVAYLHRSSEHGSPYLSQSNATSTHSLVCPSQP